jgi:hypothetical protein
MYIGRDSSIRRDLSAGASIFFALSHGWMQHI